MDKSKRTMIVFAAVMVMLAFLVLPAAAAPTIIDLRTAGAEAYHNGAWFHQSPYVGSAGTGVLDPFLRVSAANKEIVKGYNTDYRPLQYDEDASWTESLLLSTVPTIEVKGGYYREFRLDINQINSKPYLSLDVLKLYLVDAPNKNSYDPATGKFGGVSYPLVYDLDGAGDAVVLMDYTLAPGSGVSDVVMLIPESVFDAFPECDYGQPGCKRWIYLYNEFGAYGADFVNNDGFEEWATQVLPYVQVEKTAEGSREKTCTWKITKDYDATYDLFAGESKEHEYKISVVKDCKYGNYKVSGTIKITVPARLPDGDTKSPDAVVTSIVDKIDGTTVTVTCPSSVPFTVKPGSSVTCTYVATSASPLGEKNTVTVKVENNPFPFVATKGITYTEKLIGYDKIDVTDTNGGSWPFGDSGSVTYKKTFECSKDLAKYADGGKYSFETKNTAKITQTGASDDATVKVNCYAPVVSKDASGTYDERHEWDVEKTVDPKKQNAFAGQTVKYKWTVVVKESVFEENFDVSGSITVKNPAPMEMTVDLKDVLSDGTVATIGTCTDGTYSGGKLKIPALKTAICPFTANDLNYQDDSNAPNLNKATATLNGINFEATDGIEWKANVIRGSATVDDDQNPAFPKTITDGGTWTYEEEYTCSGDASLYAGDGTYTFGELNTAIVTSDGKEQDRDDASMSIDCYAPLVTKDAQPELTRTWKWKIDKVVNPTEVTIKKNGYVDAKYCVTVSLADPKYVDSDWKVSGKIYVKNPAPMAMTLDSVEDVISPSITATVTCPSLTIPAGGTLTCTYSAALPNADNRDNKATAKLNSIGFTGTATVDFTKATINDKDKCVDVTDDKYGNLGTVCSNDAPKKFEYTIRYYGENLQCKATCIQNTAKFVAKDTGATGSDDAEICITVLCDLSPVCAIKYHDLNANGKKDVGEPFLSDWYITLKYKDGTPSYTDKTDVNGKVCFAPAAPEDPEGDWYLSEALQGGWVKSEPTDDSYKLYLEYGGAAIPDKYFGNYRPVSVTACKLEDVDTNPATTGDQKPVANWKVYLSIDGVRQLPGQMTGEDGCYTWKDLKPGVKYDVEEDVPSDWYAWTDTKHDFGMSQSGDKFKYTFVNSKKVNVKVCKLEDQDGDLATKGDQVPVEGWTVILTKNGVVQDTKTTGADGCYEWKNLDPLVPPNYYDAAESISAGWYPLTLKSVNCDPIASGGTCTVNFVNSRYGSKSGYKWEDLNENGKWDPEEKGLEGWVIELWDGKGKIAETKTDATGQYQFTNLIAGKTYYVCEQLQDGWTQTYPTSGFACPAATPALGKYGYEIKLKSGEVDKDNNFGNFMPKDLYCGLTIGFWKENIDKYLSCANGRQVCDAFFEGIKPYDVCQAVTPGECAKCTDWKCIQERLTTAKKDARGKAIAQMTGLWLTMLHNNGYDLTLIDPSQYPPLTCYDASGLPYTCYDPCKKTLTDACKKVEGSCTVDKLWALVVDYFTPGGTYYNVNTAQSIADCINNYNDGCEWTDDEIVPLPCVKNPVFKGICLGSSTLTLVPSGEPTKIAYISIGPTK